LFMGGRKGLPTSICSVRVWPHGGLLQDFDGLGDFHLGHFFGIVMDYKIVIPARFASSRLPGKPLLEIGGKPMIWHTYQRALETGIDAKNVIVATDHQGIYDVVRGFGGEVVMTDPDHESGTDRLAEVASLLGWSDDIVVVNVQGDEPLLPAHLVTKTANAMMEASDVGMATLATPMRSEEEVFDKNCVKVVADKSGKALYFSRAPIPFCRDGFQAGLLTNKRTPWNRHIGMYAYTVGTLKMLSQADVAEIEHLEKLEQLRAMWLGISIQVSIVDEAPGHGVDTLEDLKRVQAVIEV
jgi:3-deoxy-manno-octulosonate cytidylyltransferase (CMP-KDO synthetase)